MARTAKQRAATKRMIAANRARRGHKRRHHSYASNPSPRRRRHATHSRRRHYRANPIHHHARRRHYRRNPAGRAGLMGLIMPSVQGAAGALAMDIVTGFLPLPLGIKVSPARHFIKALLGVGVGMVMRGNVGQNVARGIVTVSFHDAAREAMQFIAPTMTLGMEPTTKDLAGLGYYNPAQPAPGPLGLYTSGPGAGLGEMMESGYNYGPYEA